LLTGRGLKNANFAVLNAAIQSGHKLPLYGVRLERMMEISTLIHITDRSHAIIKSQILQRAEGRGQRTEGRVSRGERAETKQKTIFNR